MFGRPYFFDDKPFLFQELQDLITNQARDDRTRRLKTFHGVQSVILRHGNLLKRQCEEFFLEFIQTVGHNSFVRACDLWKLHSLDEIRVLVRKEFPRIVR